MNKIFCKKNHIFSLILAGCLILFNLLLTSCGLDTFYVIDAPTVHHEPNYNSMEQSDSYFDFSTSEREYEGIKFIGTEVYYKIYDSSSRLTSEYSSINQASSGDNSSNQAADRMIITYKYRPLRSSDNIDNSIFIPVDNKNRRVIIRLSNYHEEYKAQVSIDSVDKGIPVRSIPKNSSFDFDAATDNLPKSDDEDYSSSSSSTEINDYYVCMFAVSVAQDATYSRLYSNVAYLGSVKISLTD